jgi:hypothetical protein
MIKSGEAGEEEEVNVYYSDPSWNPGAKIPNN